MDRPRVTLREMTEDEYRTYVGEVQAAAAQALLATMPEEEAREKAAGGIAHYLPDGVATANHTLVIAENAEGAPVGNAWLGPDPNRAEGSDGAWLYDINVYPHARRHGYGAAILAAVEELAVREGKTRIGLNVVGSNEAAIALYSKSGYAVSSMQMSKPLVP
ncbi:MAG TPA: GNAT family N-acetyltransferase [Pseudonocardia sp.]|jgi:GNAT superfamily N-acetyltransferase|uniref:GNAT family N-acetyltransferase n=1 Tax=Pseudonocardia sp. TaxID=60912 RepID=UPI002B4ACB24|nr:GNAT family N-acetyltransferase [Pseudonocardia sp.]HLU58737.1 GNAT family N-acetyltransferase [Pseudonocardia sp.]